jgi:hypothetical protein
MKDSKGNDFPTMYYSCSNKPMGEVLYELSSDDVTRDGIYTFKVKLVTDTRDPQGSVSAVLFWFPIESADVEVSSGAGSGTDEFAFWYGGETYSAYLSATNTRIAQKFTTPSYGKVLPDYLAINKDPGGTLTGYFQIETDSSGDPSGSYLCKTNTQTLRSSIQSEAIFFRDTANLLDPSTDYWLVFYRTSGSGGFYASNNGPADRVKYYDGSWNLDTVENLKFAISSSLQERYMAEGTGTDLDTANIISVVPTKSNYDKINMVTLNCGDDPNGVPIIIDVLAQGASFSFGIRSKLEYKDFAKVWIKGHPEPDGILRSYPHTYNDGTHVEDYEDYVDACVQYAKDEGRFYGLQLIRQLSKGQGPKWEMNITMRGTNEFSVGQRVNPDFRTIGIGSELSNYGKSNSIQKRIFYISGINHNLDSNGWRTTLNVLEE